MSGRRRADVGIFFPWLCILCLSSASNAFAGDVRDFSTENEWNSTQINALGGVGHLSEELGDQFFSDPSLPQRRKAKGELQFGSMHFMYSRDLQSTVSDAREFQSGSQESDTEGAAKTLELLDKVRSLFGRKLTGGMNVTALAFRGGGFTLVPYISSFVDGGADIPSWPRVSARADAFAGLGVGYGFTVAKWWELGVNVRPGVRAYAEADADVSAVGDFAGSASSSESGVDSSEFASYGTGFYVPLDIGTGTMLGKETRVNLVARNVGGSPAYANLQGDKPPVYPMRLSLGLNSDLWEKGQHRVSAGSDVQDLMGITAANAVWYRWQWAGQYAYRLGNRKETSLGLNAGLRSGYPSLGLFLDLYVMKLEGAWFTRETGYYAGQRPQQAWSFRAWSQMTF
jgi:hypothetical protein